MVKTDTVFSAVMNGFILKVSGNQWLPLKYEEYS